MQKKQNFLAEHHYIFIKFIYFDYEKQNHLKKTKKKKGRQEIFKSLCFILGNRIDVL